MSETLSLDWETRSAVDLRKAGAHKYAEDPTTSVWCGCYAFDDEPVETWLPGMPCPPRVAHHVSAGGVIAGWNVTFERLIWGGVLTPRHGWPLPRLEQFEDTATWGAAMGLPRALGDTAKALGDAEQKDDTGHRLMMQMAKPRSPKDKTAPAWKPYSGELRWWDDQDRIDRLVAYCVKDVEAERALRRILLPLSEAERRVFLFDARMNDRGVCVDTALVAALQGIVEKSKARLDREMRAATGGAVTACTQVAALTRWLRAEGVDATTLAKAALEDLLGIEDLPAHVRRAIEIRKEAAKSSTSKLNAMEACVCADGRARGQHLYHGAGTGRWSGRLIQCVTGEHEVLTRSGWRRIDGVVGPCEIVQWCPGRGMSWVEGVVNAFPAPPEIAEIEGTIIRGRYTLDHRMPYVRGGKLADTSPAEIMQRTRLDGLLTTAPLAAQDCGLSDAQIRLLISFQADGTFAAGRGRGPAVWRFKKSRKIKRLREILTELALPFEEKSHDCAPDITQFKVRPDDVPAWLTKDLGAWVLRLSGRQARLAFEELAEWDGFRHKVTASVCLMSPNKEQVEWMATVAALAGIQTTLSWYTSHKSPGGRWSMYERTSRSTSLSRREVSVLANDSPVYCPTVPGGYWLCRYGDRIFITGNTQNFPRGTGTVSDPEGAVDSFMRGSVELIEILYGNPMSAVSDMLRACLRGAP